jgi:hypothetical protein
VWGGVTLKIYILYNGEFGERFIGHLTNYRNFCTSCAHLCTHCRNIPELNYSNDIAGIHVSQEGLPDFIEDASEYLPGNIPSHDITIAINIHPDIITALPSHLSQTTRAIIAPVESPNWVSPGLRNQIATECKKHGLEFAAPKPFCNLKGDGIIGEFAEYFRIGRPEFEIITKGERIYSVRVKKSQPCGCAYFVMQKLKDVNWKDVGVLNEAISGAHHSYPCTASMDKDTELGDTILHCAGYIIRNAVHDALEINTLQ